MKRATTMSCLAFSLSAGLIAMPAATAASRHPAGCGSYAKHRFGQVFKAHAVGNVVKVKYHPATFICGGEDDGHFIVATTKAVAKLHSDTVVKVLDPPGQATMTKIDAAKFPHWLKHENDEKLYKINGPVNHVRRFQGQYRP